MPKENRNLLLIKKLSKVKVLLEMDMRNTNNQKKPRTGVYCCYSSEHIPVRGILHRVSGSSCGRETSTCHGNLFSGA